LPESQPQQEVEEDVFETWTHGTGGNSKK